MVHRSMRSPLAANLLLSLGALGLVWAQPSHAADLPGVVVVHNWTGCYLGAHVGWMGGADRLSTYPGPSVPSIAPAEVPLVTNSYSSQESAGFAGGAQIGCNWQGTRSPLMLGVEMDFSRSGLRESTIAAYPDVDLANITVPDHFEVVTKSLEWFSTIRGRLGFAQDRWLAYLTGGVAVARIESSLDWNEGTFVGSDARTRFGWTAGGGLEYAFGKNWSAKVEYLYLDFGKYTWEAPHATVDQSWKVDVDAQEHVVRAGLNYRF